MAGKTSTTSRKKNTRSSSPKNASKKVAIAPKKKKGSVGRPKGSKNKSKSDKIQSENQPSNSISDIPMEKVNTIKGVIELPKRRRGRPTREEEELREKILKEHGIIGDPRIKRPRGRPRKDNSQSFISTQSLGDSTITSFIGYYITK